MTTSRRVAPMRIVLSLERPGTYALGDGTTVSISGPATVLVAEAAPGEIATWTEPLVRIGEVER